jgi:hypothetical protein
VSRRRSAQSAMILRHNNSTTRHRNQVILEPASYKDCVFDKKVAESAEEGLSANVCKYKTTKEWRC